MYRILLNENKDNSQIVKIIELATANLRFLPESLFRIFRWEKDLLIYAEADIQEMEMYLSIFENYGTSRRMLDIFHDDAPPPNWRKDSSKPLESVGSVIFLKPEMYSSYIFYHYQFQEENRKKFNSTYLIGSDGTFLFSYCESPPILKNFSKPTLLSKNSPKNWEEVMGRHFATWPDEPGELPKWRRATYLDVNHQN